MPQAVDGIARQPIESSGLASIGYALTRQVLAVEFHTGLILHYSGIGPELALAFYAAQSRGRFYAQHIRGKFPAVTMTGPCASCGANGVIGTTCTDCGCATHYRLERRLEPTDVDQVRR